MRPVVPDRIEWAVEVVDPGPDERLLEIGCGPGVAAGLVCARLTTGHLTAVDRSATAVARTLRRNGTHVAAGRLEVVRCELAGLSGLDVSAVDKAFSVNVNVFWTGDAARELAGLHRVLRPGGRLFILYGTGPGDPDRVIRTIAASLARHGFGGVARLGSPCGYGISAERTA